MYQHVRFLLVLASLNALVACEGSATPAAGSPSGRPDASKLFDASFSAALARRGLETAKGSKIYVSDMGHGDIATYSPTGEKIAPTIAVDNPFGVAVTKGKIFVASQDQSPSNQYFLFAFTDKGQRTNPTITGLNYPTGVAVGARGKIYVSNLLADAVTTYNRQGVRINPTITQGICAPEGVTVDAGGKIFVVNLCPGSGSSYVTTYLANGTQTTPTITLGPSLSYGVAVDASGKIYVTNVSGGPSGQGSVTTYAPDGSQTSPTITAGLNRPFAIAVDANGKIYVTNAGGGSDLGFLTTYNPDGSQTTPTITGFSGPLGIAVH